MGFGLREKLVAWLETKTVDDLVYVKKNPDVGIFLKHPELTPYDIELIVLEPERVLSVERALDHENRLLAVRAYTRRLFLQYILLDPFHDSLPKRFEGKVAVVTAYPTRKRSP
ncbi:MAG: hypothetical protein ACLFO2_01200 [Candidatus Woesearchaeota archaeon]